MRPGFGQKTPGHRFGWCLQPGAGRTTATSPRRPCCGEGSSAQSGWVNPPPGRGEEEEGGWMLFPSLSPSLAAARGARRRWLAALAGRARGRAARRSGLRPPPAGAAGAAVSAGGGGGGSRPYFPPRVSPLRSAPPWRLYRTANKRPAGNWYGGRARGSADPRPGMGLPGAAPPPGYCLRAGEQQGEQQPRGGSGAQPCSHPPGGGLDRAAMGSEHLHSRSNSRACCSGAAR